MSSAHSQILPKVNIPPRPSFEEVVSESGLPQTESGFQVAKAFEDAETGASPSLSPQAKQPDWNMRYAFGLVALVILINMSLVVLLSPKHVEPTVESSPLSDAPPAVRATRIYAPHRAEKMQKETVPAPAEGRYMTQEDKRELIEELMRSPHALPQQSRMAVDADIWDE